MKVAYLWILPALLSMPAIEQVIHAPDSDQGERFSTLNVPGKTGAPFRASVLTSWKYRSTTHWNKHTLYSRRTIARDTSGRVFQERRLFSPSGETKATTVSELDFYNPSTGIVLVYDPRTNQCTTQRYAVSRGDYEELPDIQQLPGASVRRESLGISMMLNLRAVGSRETITVQGQTAPSTVKEFWYSPELAINLVLKRTESNGDSQTFTVADVDLREPDPKLFTPPAACQEKR